MKTTEQTIQSPELAPISAETLVLGEQEFDVFIVPPSPELNLQGDTHVATSNPRIFKKLTEEGVGSLADGEEVDILFLGYDLNPNYKTHLKLSRTGESLRFTRTQATHPSQELVPAKPADVEGPEVVRIQELVDGVMTNGFEINYLGELLDSEDGLSAAIRDLGFSEDSEIVPTPTGLGAAIAALRSKGVLIPEIAFTKVSTIDGEAYVGSFAEGKFPASEQLGWFGHDVLSNHFRPLVVFREHAMGMAQMYARAVLEGDSIIGRIYPAEHEINTLEPEKVETEFSGRDKIDHASVVLDNFTSNLDEHVRGLYLHMGSRPERFLENSEDVITEMVTVILSSSHREELLAYLKSVGSTAYDEKTGEFSHEVFMRELVQNAQEFWGIVPEMPEENPAARVYEHGDD